MNRNSIIDKVKALLTKTTANGCTEAEMFAALNKAAVMMETYDISDEEVQLTQQEAAMLHAEPPDLRDAHGIRWRLTYGVAQFCSVQIFRRRGETGLKIIGLPSDVEFARWLLDTLADFVFAELYAHLVSSLAPRSERRTIVRSFVDACCTRIVDRMMQLVDRSNIERTSNHRALTIAKDVAIKAYMKEQGIRLRAVRSRGSANVNQLARRAGHAAGDRASLGRPVSGAAGVLRVGALEENGRKQNKQILT